MNRERIAAALFAKLQSRVTVATSSRVLRHWSDVSPADMPAMFLAQGGQRAEASGNQPSIWRYDFTVYLYAHSEESDVPPSALLNNLLDQVELAVESGENPLTGRQNMGLVDDVENSRIDGNIETDEGVLGQTAVAIVPIVVLSRR